VQINGFLESILLIPARLLNCETVYTRHGPSETELFKWYKNPAKLVPRMLSRYCAHLASRLVCVSETVGAIYKPIFPDGRVTVIPNWVSHLPDYQIRSKETTRRVHIVYVGRLERYKGLHVLLEALRGMAATLTVVGDGNYRRDLEDMVSGLDVEFVGFKSDPTPYYQEADIFVMPSLGPEGLPLVALEAMSHALPCLFSDLPVHREITENGHAAMLFRCGDVKDLREKLSALIESASRRAQYSERAYRTIESKYQVAAARRAYLQLFEVGA
jgi:glycosyltransferase involved in cell wall biosynthesis